MNGTKKRFKVLPALTTILLVVAVAGCGASGEAASAVGGAGDGGARIALVSAVTTSDAAAAAPTVVHQSPTAGATNVPTGTNSSINVRSGTAVTATFSQPMDPATLQSFPAGNLPTLTLVVTGGDAVSGTVALNAEKTAATFTPTAFSLEPNTRYTATVTTAARNVGGIALTQPVTWSFTTSLVPFTAQAPVNLGTAGTFAILSKTGVTNVYASAINGNVGTSPITGAAIDLTCPEVMTGVIYSVDAAGPPCKVTDATFLTTAVSDMELAYTDAAGRTFPDHIDLGAGEIGGLTLQPGLYKWNTGVSISTDLTLAGGPTDVWIFQIAGNLSEAAAKNVTLTGGALAKNVFWQSAGATAIGTTAHFEGTILSKTMIAVKTLASANGRLLAQSAVTLQKNTVTAPTP